MRSKLLNIGAVAAKIGVKLATVIAKVAKAAKIGKVALIGGSAASYTLLFSWQFAVLILVQLFIHESGHIWAMKRSGMKTKGIYFLPFLGAVSVPDENFPNFRTEAFVALTGPVWGLGMAAGCAAIWVFTQNAFWAVAASWMALINLFNMLPILPLDGGRVIRSVAGSVNNKLQLVSLALGFVVASFGAIYMGLWILVLAFMLGAFDVLADVIHSQKSSRAEDFYDMPIGRFSVGKKKPKKVRREMRPRQILVVLASFVVIAGIGLALTGFSDVEGADAAWEVLRD